MQKPQPFEDFTTIFCKIHQKTCLIIFPTSISLDISTVQRIYFFDVFIFFCDFLNTKKAIHGGLWTENQISVAHGLSCATKICISVAHGGPCTTEIWFSTVQPPSLPLWIAFLVFKKSQKIMKISKNKILSTVLILIDILVGKNGKHEF